LNLVQRPLLDAYPRTGQAGRVDRLAGGGDLVRIGVDGVDYQLGAFGQLERELAGLQAEHEAVAPLDRSHLEDPLGGFLERGSRGGSGKGIGVDRLGDGPALRRPLRPKGVNLALVGADKQPSGGRGQPFGRSLDLAGPRRLARGGLDGHDLVRSAGEEDVAGEDQRLVALEEDLPTGRRGELLLGLLEIFSQGSGPSFERVGRLARQLAVYVDLLLTNRLELAAGGGKRLAVEGHQVRLGGHIGRVVGDDELSPGERGESVARLAPIADHFFRTRVDFLAGQ